LISAEAVNSNDVPPVDALFARLLCALLAAVGFLGSDSYGMDIGDRCLSAEDRKTAVVADKVLRMGM
jgi:hypothetical protein